MLLSYHVGRLSIMLYNTTFPGSFLYIGTINYVLIKSHAVAYKSWLSCSKFVNDINFVSLANVCFVMFRYFPIVLCE